MDVLLRLALLIDGFNRRIGRLAVWLVLGAVLVSAATATLRYVLDWGSNALIESQWFMFGLIFLLCAPMTLYERGHVRIDILYGRLPWRGQALIDLLGGLLFLLPVCLLVTSNAWDYYLISHAQQEMSFNPGGLAWWPMKLAIPVGFALLAAQGCSEVIKALAVFIGYLPPDHPLLARPSPDHEPRQTSC